LKKSNLPLLKLAQAAKDCVTILAHLKNKVLFYTKPCSLQKLQGLYNHAQAGFCIILQEKNNFCIFPVN
jgi:hypothetical protein